MIALFDAGVDALARGLSYTAQRHQVLAENLANVETPAYRARDLVLDGTPPVPGGPPPLPRDVFSGDPATGVDGNDVDMERQMGRLAENTLMHHTLVQLLSSQFASLKQAISGRV